MDQQVLEELGRSEVMRSGVPVQPQQGSHELKNHDFQDHSVTDVMC